MKYSFLGEIVEALSHGISYLHCYLIHSFTRWSPILPPALGQFRYWCNECKEGREYIPHTYSQFTGL